MEMKGIPPSNVLEESSWWKHFFDSNYNPLPCRDSTSGRILKPNSKSIGSHVVCEDKAFLKFIDSCLHWDPDLWLTPEEGLRHEWILEGLPQKV